MSTRPRNNLSEIPGKASIWSDEDGLSWLTFEPNAEISGEDAQLLMTFAMRTYVESEYFRLVIDLRSNPLLSNEAREFASGEELQKYISAFAILANELSMKMVGNFFIQFHKPNQPTRVFTEEEQARQWLLQQKERK